MGKEEIGLQGGEGGGANALDAVEVVELGEGELAGVLLEEGVAIGDDGFGSLLAESREGGKSRPIGPIPRMITFCPFRIPARSAAWMLMARGWARVAFSKEIPSGKG